MIKFETIGMIQRVVTNPTLKSTTDTPNNSFLKKDDKVYLIKNTQVGDEAYLEDQVIKAGEYLLGFDLESIEGQILVIDGKHIDSEGIKTVKAGDLLEFQANGKVKISTTVTGLALKVTEITTLTEKAVKARIVTVPATAPTQPGSGS